MASVGSQASAPLPLPTWPLRRYLQGELFGQANSPRWPDPDYPASASWVTPRTRPRNRKKGVIAPSCGWRQNFDVDMRKLLSNQQDLRPAADEIALQVGKVVEQAR